jgi:hypothetical protein
MISRVDEGFDPRMLLEGLATRPLDETTIRPPAKIVRE